MLDIITQKTFPMRSWFERDELVVSMLEHLISEKHKWTKQEEQEYRDSILELYKPVWDK